MNNIISNFQWREFLYAMDIPVSIIKNNFDWLDDDMNHDGFIKYKNNHYHISEFMVIQNKQLTDKNWQAYLSDSYFSGLLLEVSECGEFYRIARYYS